MDGRKPDSALEQKVLVKDSQYFTPELGLHMCISRMMTI